MSNKEKNSAFIKAENIANKTANKTAKTSDGLSEIPEKDGDDKDFAKIEKYKAKAAEKRYKLKKKAELKEQRKYLKEERDRLKRERTDGAKRPLKGGYLAAVVTLSLATLILASVLTFTSLTPSESDTALENGYRRSFYNTVEQVNSMDLDLSKALATKSDGAVQNYLMDIAVNSELAENNIQQLPMEDESKFYTAKVINQVGDFAKYLNRKIINGEGVSEKDRENLNALYKATAALKRAMQNAMDNMGGDYEFKDMSRAVNGDALVTEFNELQELSASYPELIYDGPFSDGQDEETRDVIAESGIPADEITEEQAVKIFRDLFGEYGLSDAKCVGRTGGDPSCYAVQGKINGSVAQADITVKDGKLLMYAYKGSCNGVEYGENAAETAAQAFLEKAGFGKLTAVWINLDNNLYTINFAPEVGGAIIYPDLIKVRVCAETCMVIGAETSGYCKNHRERTVNAPALTKSAAREFVSENIDVLSARLAVVPYGRKLERLCYEFCGTKDDDIYYVYIDAENGRQIEMFKVINSGQGKMLM